MQPTSALQFHLSQLYHSRLAYLASFLMMTLQRSPVVTHLAKIPQLLRLPLANIVRFAVPVATYAGTTHAVTGATAVVPTGGSTDPAHATVGESFTWAFRVVGETAASYSVLGLPCGLVKSDIIKSGVSSFSGVPEVAGTFKIQIIGWRGRFENGSQTPTYTLTLVIDGGEPPTIAAQPDGGSFQIGEDAAVEVAATGSGNRYTWFKDGEPVANTETRLIDAAVERRVFVPTAAVDATWRLAIHFDDSAWLTGTGGVGFDRSADKAFVPHIGFDIDAVAFGKNASVFMRIPFELSEAELKRANQLKLRIQYEDGYVAFLNGTEVGRANAPTTLAWNSVASAEHDEALSVAYEDINLAAHLPSLRAGTNLLAIQALNRSRSNPDMLCNVELLAARDTNSPVLNLAGIKAEEAGSYTVEVTNGAGSVTSAVAAVVVGSPLSAFEIWQTEHWTEDSLIAQARPEVDSDGDGMSNLLEYYFGTDPTVIGQQVDMQAMLERNGSEEWIVLTFPRTEVAGVTPTFEVSGDMTLDSWQALTSGSDGVAIEHAGGHSTIRLPAASVGARFVRLKLVLEE